MRYSNVMLAACSDRFYKTFKVWRESGIFNANCARRKSTPITAYWVRTPREIRSHDQNFDLSSIPRKQWYTITLPLAGLWIRSVSRRLDYRYLAIAGVFGFWRKQCTVIKSMKCATTLGIKVNDQHDCGLAKLSQDALLLRCCGVALGQVTSVRDNLRKPLFRAAV